MIKKILIYFALLSLFVSCQAWIEFDVKRLTIVFIIILVIGIIGFITSLFKENR